MNDYFTRFSAAPASFKKSFGFLLAGWICHPIFIYIFFATNQAVAQAEEIILRMVAVGACLAFLLFLIRKWARALVVLGNLLIVVYDLFVLAAAPPHQMLTLLCVAVVLFTVTGSYWLFVKASRDYFNRVNPKVEPQDPPDAAAGPTRPR